MRKAADAFKVPYSTMYTRMTRGNSCVTARILQQSLSNTEELTLVRWITRLTRIGCLASPKLVIGMAEEVRRGRAQLSRTMSSTPQPIGYSWVHSSTP